jgi:arylsulfatase A-like enzyme
MPCRFVALAGLACALLACGPPAARHVVVISADTLNRSALPAFDAAAAPLPSIDALAGRSRRFTRAITTAPWTLPAHASLFTGLYPDRHGAAHRDVMLDAALPSLANSFRDAGYQTVAFTDAGFVDAARGFGRGFERYDSWIDPETPWRGPEIPRAGAPAEVHGAALFDRAIAFLEGRDDERPLFLFLHSYAVHDYFRANPWSVAGLPEHDDDPQRYLGIVTGRRRGSSDDWQRLAALYALTVQHFDRGFGALQAALERSGLRERALVVLLSDHGEGLDPTSGAIHHGGQLFPQQVRIPLLVAGPRVRAGDSDTLVSLVDVGPTLLDWMGLPPLPDVDGMSFADDLRGTPARDARHHFVMEHFYSWVDGRRRKAPQLPEQPLFQAVIRGRHWYLGRPSLGSFFEVDSAVRKLTVDLERDPELASLRALSGARRHHAARAPAYVATPEAVRQLRALGYVE